MTRIPAWSASAIPLPPRCGERRICRSHGRDRRRRQFGRRLAAAHFRQMNAKGHTMKKIDCLAEIAGLFRFKTIPIDKEERYRQVIKWISIS